MITVDINSDVGEGVGNEPDLMPFLSSCNIACGGHAGDEKTMVEVLAFAKANKLKIGAHPSYPDRRHFGRKVMHISNTDLKKSIINQVKILSKIAETNKQKLQHIKPHGALYNLAASDEKIASLIIDCTLEIDDSLSLYVPYKSVVYEMSKGKLRTVIEGFADRAYNDDYSLVSRDCTGAILTDNKAVLNQVLSVLKLNELTAINGVKIPFKADTLCIHSDTPDAVAIATALHHRLIEEGITLGK